MSKAPAPCLHIKASCLGPIINLDAPLSAYSRNLVYARNGTGKSFLTRALYYIDLHGQNRDIENAAFNLVSEESRGGDGSLCLKKGATELCSINLNSKTSFVNANSSDRIFHVFSDDFVHTELRQNEYIVDGNIESKITLDQSNIDTAKAESEANNYTKSFKEAKLELQRHLETSKEQQLSIKAGVNKRLKEYLSVSLDTLLSVHTTQPGLPPRPFKTILDDLDALKSLPIEPDYPSNISETFIDADEINNINHLLEKITAPSSISDEIKEKISSNPDFYESGLKILKEDQQESCPFCAQNISHPPTTDLIKLYSTYFADAEEKHKKELREYWKKIRSHQNDLANCLSSVARQSTKFDSLKKLIPSQRSVALPETTLLMENIELLLKESQETIGAKGKNLLSNNLVLPAELLSLYADLSTKISEINSLFKNLRDSISTSDAERKALHRECCEAFSTEFIHSNWSAVEAIHSLEKDVKNATCKLDELKKSQISDSVKDRVANTFESLVANFFGKKYSFDKTEFVLKRENHHMPRGPDRTLSDGEKTAIAFCYFIACIHKKVKTTSDYAKLYLIFDDPITSMSYDFVFNIAQILKNITVSDAGDISINPASIEQNYKKPDLLIFTHSSYFHNVCVTNKVVKKDAAFFLHKLGNDHKLSKLTKYIAPFEQSLREVFEVSEGREPDHSTGNAIRCVLEAVGRFCHPDKCDSLSNYIIYLAGEGGFTIKSVLINNLSHGTYYDETPSPDEIKEACNETIAIVEKYANGQIEVVRGLYPRDKTVVADIIPLNKKEAEA